MYHCGPTVHEYVHIGTLRAYVFADILRRTLLLNGHKVLQVVNLSDIEDGISDTCYAEAFVADLAELHIRRPSVMPRASEHIAGYIALIQTLMQKEYAYRTSDGVYFDTARFVDYGKLGGLEEGVQPPEVLAEARYHEKRSPRDFALWNRSELQGWDSPWGRGIPGRDIECSVLAMTYLGKEIDIHTGSNTHLDHHNAEVAQSEAATGKPFARMWMHHAPCTIEGVAFSKSRKNTITLRQLIEHGYNPLAYRYWLLTGHYRTPLNVSFRALDTSAHELKTLHRLFAEECALVRTGKKDPAYALSFVLAINDDLDTAKALGIAGEVAQDKTLSKGVRRATLLYFDKVLGLGLTELAKNNAIAHSVNVISPRPGVLPPVV